MSWLLVIVGVCVVFSIGYFIGHEKGYKAGRTDTVTDVEFERLSRQ